MGIVGELDVHCPVVALAVSDLSRARSRLAVALHGAPLEAGERQGDDGGGFRWRIAVAPADSASVRPLASRGPRQRLRVQTVLYAVSVEVSWNEGNDAAGPPRLVRLDTLHVASALR
jgi:hypothetical protein